jgi:nitrite reductase (NO-forming)
MRVLRLIGMALIGLALMLAAGCGGDDEKTAEPQTQTTAPAVAAETRRVDMDEYSFSPSDVAVTSGDSITVDNGGKIVHNLTVEKGPDPKEKTEKLEGTSTFAPGKSEKLTVDLSPGKYVMVCTVAGHRELGMTGTFTVK